MTGKLLNYMLVITGGTVVLAIDTARATHETAATTAASIHLYYEGSVIETPLAGFTGVPDVSGVAVMAPEQGVDRSSPSKPTCSASISTP